MRTLMAMRSVIAILPDESAGISASWAQRILHIVKIRFVKVTLLTLPRELHIAISICGQFAK
jgi:hypothetical protein